MPYCQNGFYQDNSCRITGLANTVAGPVATLVAVSELLKLLKLLVAGDCLSTWQEDMALSFSIVVESGLALCRGVGCSSDACCVNSASSALECINLSKMSIRAFWDL